MEQLYVGHAAIDCALSRYATVLPAAAQEAKGALGKWLAGIDQSGWPSVCWESSPLTTDGFPVELTMSSIAEYISYTTEVAGPEIPESTRLDVAAATLAELDSGALPEELRCQWTAMQQAGPLRYGTWASGRHGCGPARYKLYAEVPPAEPGVARAWIPASVAWPQIGEERGVLRMIGFDTAAERTELYFRIHAGQRWQVARMLRQFGFGEHAQALLDFVEIVSGRRIDEGALGRHVGCSVALNAEGAPEAVAVFGFAWAVFRGGDAVIRNAVVKMAEQESWPFQVYESLTEPVARLNTRRTRHGMTSFTVTRDGRTAFQIGIRPPDPCLLT